MAEISIKNKRRTSKQDSYLTIRLQEPKFSNVLFQQVPTSSDLEVPINFQFPTLDVFAIQILHHYISLAYTILKFNFAFRSNVILLKWTVFYTVQIRGRWSICFGMILNLNKGFTSQRIKRNQLKLNKKIKKEHDRFR